jgi:hypothetical protein
LPGVDSSTGRGQATFASVSPAPADYAFYIVSASKWVVISTDPVPSAGLVTGEVDAQSGGPFLTSSLNGTDVVSMESSASGTSAGSQVTLGLATFDGSGNVSFSFDINDAGTLTTLNSTGINTVDSTGRFTLSQGASGLVGYLITANQGVILGTDNIVTVGTFLPQVSGPFDNSSLNFTGFFGDEPFAAPPPSGSVGSLSVGVITFDGSGNLSGTSDSNDLGTLNAGQSFSDTYSVASTGRVTLTSNSLILYIVSPTRVARMSTTANNLNPALGFVRQ